MAVLLHTAEGTLIDHPLMLKRVYSNVGINLQRSGSYKMKTDLFKIEKPLKMDSQVLAQYTAEEKRIPRRSRKRKRKSELNIGEVEAQQYHSEIVQRVVNAHKDLVSKAKEAGYIQNECSNSSEAERQTKKSEEGGLCVLDNNSAARMAASIRRGDTSLTDVCQSGVPPSNSNSTRREMSQHLKLSECVNTVLSNDWNNLRLCEIEKETYIIPQKATFLLSDFKYHHIIYPKSDKDKFDLIVLDPPWQNKSVKRKKMYGSLRDEDLLNISMEDLAAPGCLVVVWVTNRMKHIKFVQNTLFPKWSLTAVAEWQWLKITKYGEMIYDINSNHKKPYEILIIGRFEGLVPQEGLKDPSCAEGKRKENKDAELCATYQLTSDNEEREFGSLPKNYVIICVPCALHSVKPPLGEVLKRYLKESPRCLELFARNLWPHWTSWGNEVLLHQHVDFYELE